MEQQPAGQQVGQSLGQWRVVPTGQRATQVVMGECRHQPEGGQPAGQDEGADQVGNHPGLPSFGA
jgi:hypothetical protein